MGNFMTGLEACANASTPCALSSALLMDGCRDLDFQGAMSPSTKVPQGELAFVARAVLNRDLIRPWMDLEFGPDGRGYPRLIIARPKAEDVKQLTDSLQVLVPMGLRVEASEIRDKLGLGVGDAAFFVAGQPERIPFRRPEPLALR